MLKIQCDDSLYHYEFPIHVYCPSCGDEFDCVFSPKSGILPKCHSCPDNTETTSFMYYSPQLPIPNLSSEEKSLPLSLSPFLLLGMIYKPQSVAFHGGHIKMILDNVYPYRTLMRDLLPVLKKGNVRAFQTKMMKAFDIRKSNRSISSISECCDIYDEFVNKIWQNFVSPQYKLTVSNEVLNASHRIIRDRPKEELKVFYDILDQIVSVRKWINDAREYVGKFVLKSDKYYPAMFYASVGDFSIPHNIDVLIETIDVDEANADYHTSFHLLNIILPLFVGLCNWMLTGEYDEFPNKEGKMKGISGLGQFASLPDGLKIEKIADYDMIKKYLVDCFNHHVRNGIDHGRTTINQESQIVEYYFKSGDPNTHDDFSLIDVCHMTYINTLHIMEALNVLHNLMNRVL